MFLHATDAKRLLALRAKCRCITRNWSVRIVASETATRAMKVSRAPADRAEVYVLNLVVMRLTHAASAARTKSARGCACVDGICRTSLNGFLDNRNAVPWSCLHGPSRQSPKISHIDTSRCCIASYRARSMHAVRPRRHPPPNSDIDGRIPDGCASRRRNSGTGIPHPSSPAYLFA